MTIQLNNRRHKIQIIIYSKCKYLLIGKVTKSCSVDGSWWKDPVTNNEKTNYTNCFPDDLTGRLEVTFY